MLDNILKRKDVLKLIEDLKKSSRYYEKKTSDAIDYQFFVSEEQILFTFYDALLKYKIIIDEEFYLREYIDQLDKLFKKLDNINDITLGIHRLICRFATMKLGIKDLNDETEREKILNYIYYKYITEGYYVHGFSSCYKNSIERYGFVPEAYINFYNDFKQVNEILNKYNLNNVLEKDFSKKEVYFTDSFVMGCYYSANSPGYLYNLVCNREYSHLKIKKDALLKGDYDECKKNLKRFLTTLEVSDTDAKNIFYIVEKEWKMLFAEERNISLMLVKRKLFDNSSDINLESIINDLSISVYEAVDRILSSRNNKISFSKSLSRNDIIVVDLEGFVDPDKKKEEDIDYTRVVLLNEFKNVYGKVSTLILLGSILISLGVIVTIILLTRG